MSTLPDKLKPARPQTPSVDIVAIRNNTDISNGQIKNFAALFKQIIDNKNKNFLEGDINMIDYIISKYTNIPLKDIQYLIKLNLKIHSEYGLLNQFGERLPLLKELKLTGSNIPFISDLGSNFRNLVVLNMDNCNLTDLSGIVCLENLTELSAKSNKIIDLFELDGLSQSLKYLNLENNLIEDMENIVFLSSLEKLEFLSLVNNPIAESNSYLSEIKSYIPWLVYHDIKYEQYMHFDNSQIEKIDETAKIGKSPYKLNKEHEKEIIKQLMNENDIENEFNKTDSFKENSKNTTQTNSLRTSTVTIKSKIGNTSNQNIFNINFSNNKTIIHLPMTNIKKPVKLKQENEKEELKKVFEKHNECLNLTHERDVIINKLDKIEDEREN